MVAAIAAGIGANIDSAPSSNAGVDFSVAKWDYSQRFPAPNNNYRVTEKEKSPEKPSFGVSDEDGGNVKFNWEVRADGVVELHL